MSSKQFLLPLSIIIAIILGILFGLARWQKDLIKESQLVYQPTSKETINETRKEVEKTLIFLEKPNRIHLIKAEGENWNEAKDSTITISLFPIINVEKTTLVDETLYFVGKDEIGKRYLRSFNLKSQKEDINIIDFIDVYYLDFLISPDNKKIAWVVLEPIKVISEKPRKEIHSNKIFSTNINGENKEIIFQKEYLVEEMSAPGSLYPVLIHWSKNGKIYFVDHYDGVGGYYPAIDIVAYQIYEIDIKTKKIRSFANEYEYPGSVYSVRISSKENFLAYIAGRSLVIKNLENDSEKSLPLKSRFNGKLFFSHDEKFLAYTSAIGDPDNEEYTITLVELSTLKKKEIFKSNSFTRLEEGGRRLYSESCFVMLGWLDEERIILSKDISTLSKDIPIYKRINVVVNKDGSGLKKISDFGFVGLIE